MTPTVFRLSPGARAASRTTDAAPPQGPDWVRLGDDFLFVGSDPPPTGEGGGLRVAARDAATGTVTTQQRTTNARNGRADQRSSRVVRSWGRKENRMPYECVPGRRVGALRRKDGIADPGCYDFRPPGCSDFAEGPC